MSLYLDEDWTESLDIEIESQFKDELGFTLDWDKVKYQPKDLECLYEATNVEECLLPEIVHDYECKIQGENPEFSEEEIEEQLESGEYDIDIVYDVNRQIYLIVNVDDILDELCERTGTPRDIEIIKEKWGME